MLILLGAARSFPAWRHAAFALTTGQRINFKKGAGSRAMRVLALVGCVAAALNWTYLILNGSALSP